MSTSTQSTGLPSTIRNFLTAHTAREVDTALGAFAAQAVVTDEGNTYRGTEEIRRFLSDAGAEFTYTTELIGVERVDDSRWVATNRIEGNFPGGTADLRYRFTLEGDRITELVIAP